MKNVRFRIKSKVLLSYQYFEIILNKTVLKFICFYICKPLSTILNDKSFQQLSVGATVIVLHFSNCSWEEEKTCWTVHIISSNCCTFDDDDVAMHQQVGNEK